MIPTTDVVFRDSNIPMVTHKDYDDVAVLEGCLIFIWTDKKRISYPLDTVQKFVSFFKPMDEKND